MLAVRHGQYNNAANRAYYAVFQAAIAALTADGIEPPAPRYWSHDFVLREYCRQAADDGGHYVGSCRSALKALQDVRLKADYETEALSRITGERARASAHLTRATRHNSRGSRPMPTVVRAVSMRVEGRSARNGVGAAHRGGGGVSEQ